ncbi:MAG: DUF3667 domain-containing protein [Gloeobacteraceae cyanobacterium ES-bin-316]|nr:DUF3667 domain-containing protein [Ferruginibacter sp.]
MQEQICKNCGNHFIGKFCNNCGEKIYSDKDKLVSHLFAEAFHFTTHFEGTFFTSLKTILSKPGQLSLDFCNGVRKKYFKPLSFFLLLVIVYLLFPVFEGLNMQLHYYTKDDFFGEYAATKVKSVMQATGMTFEQVSEIFHSKGEKVSKFLLFTIIPFTACFSWIAGFKKRRYYYDHFIFSTEAVSLFLLWGFLLLPLILFSVKAVTGTLAIYNESYLGIVILGVMLLFLSIGSRRFFKFKIWYAIVYSLLYILVLAAFVKYIYKFILFCLAINQV